MTAFNKIADQYKDIQQRACEMIASADGKESFTHDRWQKEIGEGVTRVLQDGEIIEKAAINFSKVSGNITPQMKKMAGSNEDQAKTFAATGVSSIIHPINPWMPIIHMNIRYFELDSGTSWFGGGIDLTPHYVDIYDAKWFHQELKKVCDTYHKDFYPKYKKWADDYFYIEHRKETRGIGGIFFDRLMPNEQTGFDRLLEFTLSLGKAYPDIYTQLMQKHSRKDYNQDHKNWQYYRRGRYVEFNLIYDRGTKFGLESGGNTESILLSMPPIARWEYNHEPTKDSKEEETIRYLRKNIDWLDLRV